MQQDKTIHMENISITPNLTFPKLLIQKNVDSKTPDRIDEDQCFQTWTRAKTNEESSSHAYPRFNWLNC